MKQFLIALLLSLISVNWPSTVAAARIFYSSELKALLLDGTIESDDLKLIQDVAESATGGIERLYLHSPGGDFMSAIEIGYWVRAQHLSTYASGSMCYSACGFIWLGGEQLYTNGVVLLHMPFYRTSMVTIEIPGEGIANAAWYLAHLGYSKRLLDALLVVSSTETNEMFPITGPNTALFDISYKGIRDEKQYKDALATLRLVKAPE